MTGLSKRVASTIERHRMFDGARRIGIAVSGGADSVCLLQLLREFAPHMELCLTVMHVDHQLRGEESRLDVEFVKDVAARLGLPFVLRTLSLPASGNLEENARAARLQFYRETIQAGTVERVAVGHTRSDQAETVLFRLLRGSGSAGLAGIRPVTAEGVVRPLIEVDRAEVEEHLRSHGIVWREDSTNASPRFARNRIRHELLPQLARDWNPEIGGALARLADQAAGDEDYWRAEIDALESSLLVIEDGAFLLETSGLRGLRDAVARRLIRRAIERVRGDLMGIDFRHIEDVLRLARSGEGCGRVQAHGIEIRRSFDRLRFAPPAAGSAAVSFSIPATVPGAVEVPGTGWSICLELIENSGTSPLPESVYNGGMACVDWGRVSSPLAMRSWMSGDRFQPVASSGIKKLKDLFQLARIPSWERLHWPVLVEGDAIVWTRRFGPATEYAAGPQSRTILRIRENESTGKRNRDPRIQRL